MIAIGIVAYVAQNYGIKIKENAEVKARELIREKLKFELSGLDSIISKERAEELITEYLGKLDSTDSYKKYVSPDSIKNYIKKELPDSFKVTDNIKALDGYLKDEK